jgi:hypothetical protein
MPQEIKGPTVQYRAAGKVDNNVVAASLGGICAGAVIPCQQGTAIGPPLVLKKHIGDELLPQALIGPTDSKPVRGAVQRRNEILTQLRPKTFPPGLPMLQTLDLFVAECHDLSSWAIHRQQKTTR